ncbi:hypothetical protein [Mycolicibacterium pulveris]|uniref:hypothetical protein n=1 Tax=Mycolicibacterium pulveris TaxID=36813 RepID=UPI003CF0804A
MLSGERVLVTGPAGRIAYGVTKTLARDNEVWGIARFSDPAAREEVEALGVTTRSIDLGDADFTDLPTDFTYLVHIAVDFGENYERGLRVNAEGTGLGEPAVQPERCAGAHRPRRLVPRGGRQA